MQHDPESAAVAEAQLRTLIGENRFLDALQFAETARAAFPSLAVLAALQAYLCLRLGRGEQAVASAKEAIALGADDSMTLLVLGLACRSRGRHAEAAEILLDAHRRFPDQVNIAGVLIEAMVEAHGAEATRPVFDEVYAHLPDREVALIWAKLAFAAGVDDAMPPGIASAPVRSVRSWMDGAGLSLDYEGPREIIPFQVPEVFGEPAVGAPLQGVPGYISYATALRDATIFSRSGLVLMPDGVVLNDTLVDERFGRFMDLPHDKTVLARRGEQLLLDLGQHPVTELAAGIMLSGWASQHFGHWVPEYLCRLAYLENHPRFADLPIIVDADMPPQHLEFLRLLVSNPVVELPLGGALKVGELIVGSPSCFFPVHLSADHTVPPENQAGLPLHAFRYLRGRIAERLPPPAIHDRKLYLARKASTWRKLLNEDEIIAAVAARGFEVLHAEEMSVEQQVRMYQEAQIVVAPNGSSLLNAVFAAQDMKLIVLAQRGLSNWGTYFGPMREFGYDLTTVCGETESSEKHADYAIPVPRLMAAIEAFSK